MSTSGSSKRTHNAPPEQRQQQRGRELTPFKPRRIREPIVQDDSPPPVPTSHRYNSSRRSLSRSPVPHLASSAREAAPDSKQAPKNFNSSHDSASPDVVNDEHEPSNPKKGPSRRRRSTISTASPATRDEGRAVPKIPVKQDVEEGSYYQKSILSPVKYPRMRSPMQPDYDTRWVERRDHMISSGQGRVPSPSPTPTIAFKEDIFSGGNTLRRDPQLPSNSPETPHRDAARKGVKGVGLRPGGPEADSSPRVHHNVLHKKIPRPSKSTQKEYPAESYTIVSEKSHQDIRRRPESLVSPKDPWYRSFPSPPRPENEILPDEYLQARKSSESHGATTSPSSTQQFDTEESHVGANTRGKSRRISQRPRHVNAGFSSSPPSSSGVTHYATASDHSLEPSLIQITPRQEETRRDDPKTHRQDSPSSFKRRSSPFELEKVYSKSTSRSAKEHSPASREPKPSSLAKLDEDRSASVNKPTRKQELAFGAVEKARSQSQVGLKPSLRHTPTVVTTSPSFSQRALGHSSSRASPLSHIQATASLPRDDDSMTYVAVTASGSSPQSDPDHFDEFSEASNYTDHETPETAQVPFYSQERTISETQAVQRRDALLTGLGLSNLKHSSLRSKDTSKSEEYDDGIRDDDEPLGSLYPQEVESKSGYLVPDDGYHSINPPEPNLARQDIKRSYDSSSLPLSASSVSIRSHTPIPSTRNRRRSSTAHGTPRARPSIDDERPSFPSERSRGALNSKISTEHNPAAETGTRRVSHDKSRRDTWIYEEDERIHTGTIDALEPDGDDQGSTLYDTSKDISAMSWSDRESINDMLSEGAQQMLSQLQQSSSPRDGPRDIQDTKDRKDQYLRSTAQDHDDTSRQSFDNTVVLKSIIHNLDPGGLRTWRNTISSSAYQSLLERHGAAEMKRQDLIFELCETEMAFVKSMKLVLQLFYEPLRTNGLWVQGVPAGPSQLLEWLEDITDLHSEISSTLNSARASQFPLILHFADNLRSFIPRLEVHLPFLVHLESVSKEVDDITQDSRSKYGGFIRAQTMRPECGNMGLTSFLLKPMQRLTKYPLFFKQIWELTPRNHPDHLPMFSLYHSMNLVLKVIQEVKAREEELAYIKDLANRISNLPKGFDLARRERRLIAQGLLRRIILSDKDKEALEGFNTPLDHSREPSPLPSMPISPVNTGAPSTPPLPDLRKLGPITSPLFPGYHNKTPIPSTATSPFMPRQSYMSAVSRASTAVSEASQASEWMVSNSPTSSVAISSDFDVSGRPESSASSTLSMIHSPLSSFSPTSNLPRRPGTGSVKGSRSKGTREAPVHAFVFTDLVLFTTQTEKQGLFQSKSSQILADSMTLVDTIGVSRVLGACDRSGKLDYDYLFQVDILPISFQDSFIAAQPITSVYLSLPSTSNSRLNLKPTEQMMEAKEKWLAAFDRAYGYTLRSLTFPSLAMEAVTEDMRQLSVMNVLASGLPLPKSPTQQPSTHEDDQDIRAKDSKIVQYWSLRFQEILREIERIQETPVMLIGDAALTMGRGLKRVQTPDRTKRKGPQQLLLVGGTAMNSSPASSTSSNSRKGLLGLKKR